MIFDHGGVQPNPARGVRLPVRAEARATAADRRARRGRPPPPADPLPAAAARARRDRDAARRARGADLGRRRRAPRPLARLSGGREDGPGALGERRRRCSSTAVTALVRARGPHARPACLPGVRRRPVPDGDRAGLHGGRRAGVLPARPPPPPDLAAAPRRRAVGADRRARRPAQPRRDREHLQPRAGRRGRARLRRVARMTEEPRRFRARRTNTSSR